MDSDEEFLFEPEFLPEVNVLERIAFRPGVYATQMEIQTDPVKRFRVYTNSTAVNLSTNKILPGLTRNDVDEINRKAEMVRNPQYKNPLGFVLGYYLIQNGEINMEHISYVKKNLNAISGNKLVKMVDIIRYARLWLTQL